MAGEAKGGDQFVLAGQIASSEQVCQRGESAVASISHGFFMHELA